MQDWLSCKLLDQYSRSDNWRNVWTENTLYYRDDIVRYGGNPYRCLTGHRSSTLTTGQIPYTTGATGTNAAFFVWRVGTTYYVNITNAGSGYANLNTFSIVGTALGGDLGSHDAVITNTVDGAGAFNPAQSQEQQTM